MPCFSAELERDKGFGCVLIKVIAFPGLLGKKKDTRPLLGLQMDRVQIKSFLTWCERKAGLNKDAHISLFLCATG